MNEIRADIVKAKKMVSEVEMIIGKREGEGELVNKLIDAENLLTYCMSRLENAIVPPCKVGDTVYDISSGEVLICTIEKIEISLTERMLLFIDISIKYPTYSTTETIETDYFGKTVFLTKEEAEQKLKEMRCE